MNRQQSTLQARIAWENDVYDAIQNLMDVDRSDAQAFVMLHEHVLDCAFDEGEAPEDVAKQIDNLVTVSKSQK